MGGKQKISGRGAGMTHKQIIFQKNHSFLYPSLRGAFSAEAIFF